MIDITKNQDCCGCWACAQRCPKSCISMHEDNEGFLYPDVNKAECIDCGLCDKVCPVINQNQSRQPIKVYAAKNKNEEIRLKSSSGGIFTPLAEAVINRGGVVFGVKFDSDWNVVHDYAETLDGIAAFRGSKYVQSVIGQNYIKAETFLKTGREVLFTGTPCQIAGLHKFLQKTYDNLLTVDLVCHGVPSPLVWREYLKNITIPKGCEKNTVSLSLKEKPVITGIAFRDKTTGWKKYGFVARKSASKADENTVLLHETLDKNLFMQGFLKNLYLRPSCHACPSREGKGGSDITIADYWGIQRWLPEFDDDKGVGLVLVNTPKGAVAYDSIGQESIETTYAQAIAGNPCMEHSAVIPKYRELFWYIYNHNGIDAINAVLCKIRPSIFSRLFLVVKRAVRVSIHTALKILGL